MPPETPEPPPASESESQEASEVARSPEAASSSPTPPPAPDSPEGLLIAHLREMFQFDCQDLDFGIFRIMNAKREQIDNFLTNRLLPQVKEILKEYRPDNTDDLESELAEKEEKIEAEKDNYLPERLDKLRAEAETLRRRIDYRIDVDKTSIEIYSHLYNFFSRYYDEGDFMSLRRYKAGVYALPYEGEEVKLHWANSDQYYIKTSENLKHYAFKTSLGKNVRFEIKSANTEKNNNKAANDKQRRFWLASEDPVEASDDTLTIFFEYRPDNKENDTASTKVEPEVTSAGDDEAENGSEKKKKSKTPTQDKINEGIIASLASRLEYEKFGLNELAPTEKKPKRTVFEKHLDKYVKRFTFDYFIHKDLGGFLRRELDFFIKNEVMHLDDIEEAHVPKVESILGKLRTLRKVAHSIIKFLAQLEEFQKKLWLKKKFVLETNYYITLDHIIERDKEGMLLPLIASNQGQVEAWMDLFAIDEIGGDSFPLTVDFLMENDKLPVDTRFFDADFKYAFLSLFDDLDEQTDGVLIESENFQALNLLQDRCKEQVQCIYIDPPYNTDSNAILYKNNYKHSSWLSLIENRFSISNRFLIKDDGLHIIAIDDAENARLQISLDIKEKTITPVSVIHNPSGKMGSNFSKNGEYAIFIHNDNKRTISMENREDAPDVRDFMNTAKGAGENYLRESGKECFYPIFIKDEEIVGFGPVCEENFHPDRNVLRDDGIIEVYPIDQNNVERKWILAYNTIGDHLHQLKAKFDHKLNLFRIERTKNEINYKTIWTKNTYSAKKYGTQLLGEILPDCEKMEKIYPKSLYLVKDCIHAGLNGKKQSLILDYFAGSGTTGHAVINLNREDGGKRKYILVEMGEYFSSVTLPRVLKAAYSTDWKDGKPVSRNGVSQIIKYMLLEQYEDTLDNLEATTQPEQSDIFKKHPEIHEGYMLGYMLDKEEKDSPSLLNIEEFTDPFNYGLEITRNDEKRPVRVDLVETFNYLIGLQVKTIARDPNGIVEITGIDRRNQKCLIIWRNTEKIKNPDLNDWFKKKHLQGRPEAQVIYVNGDNNLENIKPDGQQWEVKLTEQEFKRLMFATQDT